VAVAAINIARSPTGNSAIRARARAGFWGIIATERREAAGSFRAVYNRRLKLASQQVILVHAVYPPKTRVSAKFRIPIGSGESRA
jgi:hypothetical protein